MSATARAHLLAVACEPRPAGGEAEARARTYCAGVLAAGGFDVREVPFEYSEAVGRWAMPTAGLVWAIALGIAAMAGGRARPAIALGVLLTALALVAIGARWATREGVLGLPVLRARSVNLIATRGSDAPSTWLIAHLDSKSQPVPMAARVAGVAASALLWLAAIVMAAAQALGAPVANAWAPLAIVGLIAALPVIGSVIGARSPGAIDNGSGVATVLLAATDDSLDAPPLPMTIGVLLTSAEEVALAGARAWVRSTEAMHIVARGGAVAINVDSVDDRGALRVMDASSLPAAVNAALGSETSVRRGRLPAGVLVDAIALADGGFAALTVSRATVATLARIHTRGDSLDAVRGEGIIDAAQLVRRLAAAAAPATTRVLDQARVPD